MKGKVITALIAVSCCALLAGAGCAPQVAAEVSDSAALDQAAVSVEWSPDSDCDTCHITELDTFSSGECLASRHGDISCSSCHSDPVLKEVHASAGVSDKMPKRLKKSEVTKEVCLGCHEADIETLSSDSSAISVTDVNGLSVNPHALPSGEKHDEVNCSDCHAMHQDTPLQDQADALCKSCHHTGVFECYTCHE